MSLIVTLLTNPSFAQERPSLDPSIPGVLSPKPENSAMFRWWLPAAEVEEAVIIRQLEAVASAQFKGVELCIHMGDTRYPRTRMRDSGWGSTRWNALYKTILKNANRLGLQVDTTISPAWPAAVPSITPEDMAASQELRMGFSEVFSGTYTGELPASRAFSSNIMPPPPGAPGFGEADAGPNNMLREVEEPDRNPERLVAVTAARVIGAEEVEKTVLAAWGDMHHEARTLRKTATLLDSGGMLVVRDPIVDPRTGEYSIRWTPPDDGQWQLFTFWARGTAQQNKEGASTFRPNYVIDHLSKAGAEALMQFWERHLLDAETRQLLRENGGALFEDSLELEYGGLPWTPDLLAEFKRLRGYDLTPYLPLFLDNRVNGLGNDELNLNELGSAEGEYSSLGDRIRNDFREVLTELYISNHLQPLQQWAHSLGLSFRAQAYGLGVDIVRAAMAIPGPDGESLGFGPSVQGDDRFRMIAGGAHLRGGAIVSDEVGAIANEGYRLTWLDMLQWTNKNFAAGANQMVFHGMAYSDSNASRWPGISPFGFGLAGYWGPRNPDWQHIEQLAHYFSRVQAVLQRGVAKVDLAVIHFQYGTSAPVVEDQSLASAGFTYDILTPAALNTVSDQVEQGVLLPGGPAYKAVVVPSQKFLSVESATQLRRLNEHGVKLAFVGETPNQVPFYSDHASQDSELRSIIDTLLRQETVVHVESIDQLPPALNKLEVSPELEFLPPQGGLVSVRRHIDGNDAYFLYNPGTEPLRSHLQLQRRGMVHRVDPWTGAVENLNAESNGHLLISLAPGEATLLFNALATRSKGISEPVVNRSPRYEELDNWSLKVENWQENKATEQSSDTHKSLVDVGTTALVPWKSIRALGEAVSGIGGYRTELQLSEWVTGNRAVLALGSIGDSSSARVHINGRQVPINLFSLEAEIGAYLHQGLNVIEVEITSPLGNRLISEGAITAPPWDATVNVEYEDYGLLGPVSLSLF
ncbi:glycosyl hydrolase [Parahaliea maris]|uniref:glycosyl hydrolase n=1 Tax=Parahaliea maris TaxID=2716870 RepID=UPI00164F152F|nr:glycosyl hydrolase [Parahaliea maris]